MPARARVLPPRRGRASRGGSASSRGGRDHARRLLRDAPARGAKWLRRILGPRAAVAAASSADRAETMAAAGLTQYDVAVIGAGFAGLSAAVRLARRGARVLVVEARGRLGG